ncbi:hypothetical protein GCM10011517_04790 [Actibacterium pelagium]|uniref:Tetratricopeptide repeat-like domain-containing protein n=2 Tax=Actibacterium pelagium TaxID=2029103 RepID=A0A917EGF6_9RHOB|nr:hypothetical protein [Actibacterium pelagium]GGE40123.1 hypothetical protein GCM10011517_04790 [Actibacterium pelagium]
MSNPDSFIEEVTEEVRRERLFQMFRRYGWIGITAVVLIVGGAAWNEWNKAKKAAEAQALGDAILSAAEAGDAAALDAVPVEGEAAAVVAFLASAEELASENPEGAMTRLQAIADNTTLPLAFRDLAAIKRVLIGAETLDVATRREALTPLAVAGAPYRAVALEQLALLTLEEGDTDGAISQLNEILTLEEVTQGLRQRAAQLIVALGGVPAN